VIGLLAALAIGVCLLSAAAPAFATDAPTAIDYTNQQRAATGIPPLQQDDSLLKPTCTLENHEIASPRTSWSVTLNPWEEAPIHQTVLYDPAAKAAAYGEYPGFSSGDPSFPSSEGTWACMWFTHDWDWAQAVSPSPSFFWAAEGPGPNALRPAIRANEFPSTPAQLLGLPAWTGPNLLVFGIGMGKEPTIVAASITSSSGQAVDVRALDAPKSNGRFLSWWGILVMPNEAQPDTSYNASVTWRRAEDGFEATQSFAFHTAAEPPPPSMRRAPRLRIAKPRVRGHRLVIRLRLAPEAIDHGKLTLAARRPGHLRILKLDKHLRVRAKLGSGRWTLQAWFRSTEWRSASTHRRVLVQTVTRTPEP
jgi:hypothetical protein